MIGNKEKTVSNVFSIHARYILIKFNYRIEKSSENKTIHLQIITKESSREKSRNCDLYRSHSCFKINLMFWTTVQCLF